MPEYISPFMSQSTDWTESPFPHYYVSDAFVILVPDRRTL